MAPVTTSIATWGNSEAIRIPKALLTSSGLRPGDRVQLLVSGEGRIEVRRVSAKSPHRRVVPKRHLSFDELFVEYDGGRLDNTDAWPEYDSTDAERESWSS